MLFSKKKPEPAPIQPVIEEPEIPRLTQAEEEPVIKEEARQFTPAGATKIGKGITFYGDFTGEDPIVVNGSVMGDISTTSSLTVSESGAYSGNAEIHDLEIDGSVKGDIQCENSTILGEKSVMKGHLSTTYLETRKGSTFKGKLEMINAEDSGEELIAAPQPSGFSRYEPVEFNWNTEKKAAPQPAAAEPAVQAAPDKDADEPSEDLSVGNLFSIEKLPEDLTVPDIFAVPETEEQPR